MGMPWCCTKWLRVQALGFPIRRPLSLLLIAQNTIYLFTRFTAPFSLYKQFRRLIRYDNQAALSIGERPRATVV